VARSIASLALLVRDCDEAIAFFTDVPRFVLAEDTPLAGWDEVLAHVQSGIEPIDIKDLPGGRYAVVRIEKDPAVIGSSIDRFYQEYVPQSRLELDGRRPTREIYYESTMEYCVPVL
jgi:DNA gyrase inhibitor GyrI